jgi:hypothetical protein
VLTQALMVFERFKRQLPKRAFRANEAHKTITVVNGTKIWFKSGDHPDSLYGEDVFAAVMDEAARTKEEAWHAVRTTLTATKGRLRIIGNVKGRKNWAYRLGRCAEAGDPTMHYAKITAREAVDAGIFDAEELADAERKLPAAVFRELYYAEASDDQGNPFGLDAIRANILPTISEQPVAVWGVDLAKSTDWTVAIGLDARGTVAGFHRWQGSWELTIPKLEALSPAPTLVDATGVGDPVFERLQRADPTRFFAFTFTAQSKQQLMEGLAVAIQRQEIRYPVGPIVQELEAFEYEYTRTGVRYTAPAGLHDDCVVALALAVEQRAHIYAPYDWWAGLSEAQTKEEAHADWLAQQTEARRVVEEAIRREGVFWPTPSGGLR